jgi:excisionase family DNA binding protein
VKECARLLSVDESTVRHLARQGELRYRKLSERKWLIQLRSVREFASKVVAA